MKESERIKRRKLQDNSLLEEEDVVKVPRVDAVPFDIEGVDINWKGNQKEVTEMDESLSERGIRLAQETIQQARSHGSTSTLAAQTFFGPRTRPETPKRDRTPVSDVTTPTKHAHHPATANSPSELNTNYSSYMPSKGRSERASALLSDAGWLAKHSSTAEDFLEKYFSNSRLHHISTWKEELKAYVADFQTTKKAIRRKKLTGTPEDRRTVFHVDFDCFFVSAGLTKRPELRGKPVAVCHGGTGEGSASTSEIASCSYEARTKGVKNGISLGRARELCPDIQTIPFEFDLYRSISEKFYRILLDNSDFLEARSVDEVIMEVSIPERSTSGSVDPALDIAHRLRSKIKEATGCEASIGISHNILLARLATRKAKPASTYHLLPDEVSDYLFNLRVGDLPGIGWSTDAKLIQKLSVETVGDLLKVNKSHLQTVIGKQNGAKFYDFARGIDPTELATSAHRQSVSAEINYGIRFTDNTQVEKFLRQLAMEVSRRLQAVRSKCRFLNLKVMVRHPDAPIEAPKFLGCGRCNTFNASSSVSGSDRKATDDGSIIGDVTWRLMQSLMLSAHELRGIGISLSKLEKEGVPVDVVREEGQGTLSWRPPKTRLASPKVILHTPASPPSKVQRENDIIELGSSSSSDRTLPEINSRYKLPHRSDLVDKGPTIREPFIRDASLYKKETRDKKKLKIAPLFKTKKRKGYADVNVTDEDLEHLGIDVDFFHNIPHEDQLLVLSTQRAKVLPRSKVQMNVTPSRMEKKGAHELERSYR